MVRLQAENSNSISVQKEISNRQQMINTLGNQLQETSDPEQRARLSRKIRDETELQNRARLQQQQLLEQNREEIRRKATERLFCHADIIATTLSSSMNGQMQVGL